METVPFICVLLAGCSSALQGLLYKMGGEKGNRPDAFLSAFMFSAMIVPATQLFRGQATWGDWQLWVLGCVMGALVYASVQCLIAGNKRGPSSIAWAFMSLSLLVAVVEAASFLPTESLLPIDALTLLLFAVMVWVMQRGMAREAGGKGRAASWVFWLLMAGILLTNGSYMFGLKLKNVLFGDQNTFALALLYPMFGGLMAFGVHLFKRWRTGPPLRSRTSLRAERGNPPPQEGNFMRKPPIWTWREIWTGLLAGLCAGAGNVFMLGSMSLPTVVSFPIMQGMGLVGGIAIMAIAYKERFNRAKVSSIALALVVLLVAIFREQVYQVKDVEERKEPGQAAVVALAPGVVHLNVPAMSSLEDAEYLTRALSELDGVRPESIECDTDNGVITLSVRGRSPTRDDIKRAIVKAGFAVEKEEKELKINN